MIRLFALMLLLVPLLLAQEPKPLRIGLVTGSADDFWKVVEAGARQAADAAKVELIVKKPANGEVEQQAKLIDELVADKVAGLVVSPIDTMKQGAALGKIARTTPLALFDNEVTESGRLVAVLSDHRQGGKLAGQLVKEALPKGAVVVVFVGASQSWGTKERLKGMYGELGIDAEKDTKSKDGKYRLFTREPFQDGVNPAQAKMFARETLTQLKDEANICLVGVWGYHGPALLGAVKELGLTGKVTLLAFEDQGETLRGIEDGSIYAAVAQNPQMIAARAVQALVARARKEPGKVPPGGLDMVPHFAITKAGGAGRVKATERYAELDRILAP